MLKYNFYLLFQTPVVCVNNVRGKTTILPRGAQHLFKVVRYLCRRYVYKPSCRLLSREVAATFLAGEKLGSFHNLCCK